MGNTTTPSSTSCTCYHPNCDKTQKELIKNQKFLEQKQRNSSIITLQKFILYTKTKQTRNYITSYITNKASNYIYYNNSSRKSDPTHHKHQLEQTLQETITYLTTTYPDDQCEHLSLLRNSFHFETCWLTLKQQLLTSINTLTSSQQLQHTFTLSAYDSLQCDYSIELDKALSHALNTINNTNSNNSSEPPFLFKSFETHSPKHIRFPKCLYNITKALYSVYLYRKSQWLKTTNKQYVYVHKKNILKTLDMRLKENERQTTKVITISNDVFPKYNNKRYFHSTTTTTNVNKDIHIYNIYNGELDKYSSLYHGYGILIKNNNVTNRCCSYYEGLFKNGKRNGFGIFIKEQHNTFIYYIGEFKRNKYNGNGIKLSKSYEHITIQKGTFTTSTFTNGEQHTYNTINKTYQVYKGNFNSNEQFNDDNGYLLIKHFKQSKTHSHTVDSIYKYKGGFNHGMPNGYGELYNDFIKKGYSYTYKGNFINGKKEGYGVITYSDNYFIKQYEGMFHNDEEFYLYGKVLFKSGDVYEGFFDMNCKFKNGVGLYSHYDVCLGKVCDRFFGEFGKDKKEGLGVFVAPLERKSLIGRYCNGEKVGVFELNEVYVEEKKKKMVKNGYEDNSGLQQTYENTVNESDDDDDDNNSCCCCSNIKQNKMYLLMENNDIVDKAYQKENLVF